MESHEVLLLIFMAAAVVLGATWAAAELGGAVEWFSDYEAEGDERLR